MIAAAWLLGCGAGPASLPTPPGPPLAPEVIEALSMVRVRDGVDTLASDALGGRIAGSPGHDEAVAWLAQEMAAAGLVPAGDRFEQPFPLHLDRTRYALDASGHVFELGPEQTGTNLLGLRPGTDPAGIDAGVVLLVAHYDHLGVDPQGAVYNGAFDDAAAVCALLELARVLDEQDVRLPRSIAFLFTDGEEDGLDGARRFVAAPDLPPDRLVAALSIDPIGRPLLTDYRPLFTIGAERSPELTEALRSVSGWVDAPIRRLSRAPVVLYASDQDAFWEAPSPIPALWVSSGGMSFYHTPDDDPITIDYRSVSEHLAAIAMLTATLAADADLWPVDRGPVPLRGEDLAEAVRTIEGALSSAELTDEERALGASFRETLARGVEEEDASDPVYISTYAAVLLYVIQQLAPAHPGPIPPPFPE